MITHAASRKQYTVLLDRCPGGIFLFLAFLIRKALLAKEEFVP